MRDETYIFNSKYGDLVTKRIQMDASLKALEDWHEENDAPEPPMIKPKYMWENAKEVEKIIADAKKEGKSIAKHKAREIWLEQAELIPDEKDEEYLKELADYNGRGKWHMFTHMIDSGAVMFRAHTGEALNADKETLQEVLADSEELSRLYVHCMETNMLTESAVIKEINMLKRTWRGSPLLDWIQDERKKPSNGGETFFGFVVKLCASNQMPRHEFEDLPIRQQSKQAAAWLVTSYESYLLSEEARERNKNKAKI